MAADAYATILELFGDRLERELRERVRLEIYRRVLDEFLNPNRCEWWWRTTSNSRGSPAEG